MDEEERRELVLEVWDSLEDENLPERKRIDTVADITGETVGFIEQTINDR